MLTNEEVYIISQEFVNDFDERFKQIQYIISVYTKNPQFLPKSDDCHFHKISKRISAYIFKYSKYFYCVRFKMDTRPFSAKIKKICKRLNIDFEYKNIVNLENVIINMVSIIKEKYGLKTYIYKVDNYIIFDTYFREVKYSANSDSSD
ncbi:hypothetical protein Metev_0449 [Methanohalobium evestigatum Z-7303]|uniref:Uncharacterized protein n=1 Tax=Methanohalobium evestigatum (strain ATCC BAA-1072 / DSM 3721 / NBRC 107634 / OCM 161 / Z-7303) TaxID=644295 RepID=D7E822_METEZ|nr:hypothetical protein [Methanohalobium evestigatum]ADI73364.1 hypothetical protein Metev_0449 [Methanohalobium evestigatum Z-7303]